MRRPSKSGEESSLRGAPVRPPRGYLEIFELKPHRPTPLRALPVAYLCRLPQAYLSARFHMAKASAAVCPAEEGPSCDICFEPYQAEAPASGALDHRPQVLPCGHSVCTDCVDKLFKHDIIRM